VGVTSASGQIEPDRYSHISPEGTTVVFLDTLNTFKGWKTVLDKKNAWIRYNAVDFGSKKLKHIQINAASLTGGKILLRLDEPDGAVLAEIKIPEGKDWSAVNARVSGFQKGIHDLVVVLDDDNAVEIDWIKFLK
jgi:hypothetical protein